MGHVPRATRNFQNDNRKVKSLKKKKKGVLKKNVFNATLTDTAE